jgi:hypothetical protein
MPYMSCMLCNVSSIWRISTHQKTNENSLCSCVPRTKPYMSWASCWSEKKNSSIFSSALLGFSQVESIEKERERERERWWFLLARLLQLFSYPNEKQLSLSVISTHLPPNDKTHLLSTSSLRPRNKRGNQTRSFCRRARKTTLLTTSSLSRLKNRGNPARSVEGEPEEPLLGFKALGICRHIAATFFKSLRLEAWESERET